MIEAPVAGIIRRAGCGSAVRLAQTVLRRLPGGQTTTEAAPRTDEACTASLPGASLLGALGGRGALVEAPAEGGLELAATSDALVVRTSSDEVREDGMSLAASQADVTRLRLGLEGTWRGLETAGGGRFEPGFELGVRHDGGDAERGFGADVGAGLAWTDPSLGVKAELRARGLLTHEAGGFRERGFAGALAWDPEAFETPDRLDVGRSQGAHVSFGRGAHHCLGAALARLQGRIVFEMLIERFSQIGLLGERPRFRRGIVLRGLHSLALRCVRA